MSNVDLMLTRLQKVKATSRESWLACCPAHDDRSPSLTIRETQDGRILLHCFAGCSPDSVLGAIGLEMTDLFPGPIGNHKPRENRSFYPADVLKAIQFESRIVLLAAYSLRTGKALPADDIKRLETAMYRINEAVELANV